MSIREDFIAFIHQFQDDFCDLLEGLDGKAKFEEDNWERAGGGGGRTRIIKNGNVFEKGGVNTSIVFGEVTDIMRQQLKIEGYHWFACGISVVLHPVNPFVPTLHCNYRFFEMSDKNNVVTDSWFGGGTDLTPYYLFETDAITFHRMHQQACNSLSPGLYEKYKKQCDDYFVNTHRGNERRGVGGIFYDHEKITAERDQFFWLNLAGNCKIALMESYAEIVNLRREIPYTSDNKFWQEIRRGRYVEFNLLHDRGTIFGLKTDGRTESILMSLPPTVRFEYRYYPAEGSPEAELEAVLLQPKDWLA